MSHFSVAVITPSMNDVERLLAPFQENNRGNCPEEYLVFFDVEEEYRRSYETESAEYVEMEDGRLLSPYHSIFRTTASQPMLRTHEVPSHLKRVRIPHQEKYTTLDDYLMQHVGYSARDEKTRKWGYWDNPNAKWDSWQIGGSWSNTLLLRSGEQVNAAPIKDIFFIEQELGEGVTVTIEDMPVPAALATKLKICLAHASQEWEKVMEGKGSDQPEYYMNRYGDKQSFLREMLSVRTYAVVTPDGNWHAPGEMGRFGISSERPEEATQFNTSFYDTFIKDADPEHFVVIVDCHM
ncbi:hypothetical protein [Paenibacillus wenxiniae]|uniref:Uncharacterized protein n=1 Tax=Paenibacillus wenxiniae TaxID=1636843 RepID=A0ABW4RDH8_9BACL